MKPGRCQNCGMAGLLRDKPMMPERDALDSGDSTLEKLPILAVCVTCFNTPMGCVSENVKHKRLPEQEYLKR